jgi:hypothetical protein
MRQQLIDALRALDLGTFDVSSELPYSSSGTPLFLKTVKRFYVDQPQREMSELFPTFGGVEITQDVWTITVSVSCDAKQPPANYNQVIDLVRQVRLIEWSRGYRARCNVSTVFEGDILVTTFDFEIIGIVPANH